MRRGVLPVLVFLALAGCAFCAPRGPAPSSGADLRPRSSPERSTHGAEVADIKVWALPESPVMNWSAERGHWAAVLALRPDELPTPPPLDTCKIGPALDIRLRSGQDLTYECSSRRRRSSRIRKYVLYAPSAGLAARARTADRRSLSVVRGGEQNAC